MGFSKLKIPRICEHCSKPFEAKTVTNTFCSSCANKEGKERNKQEKVQKETEDLLL